MNVENRPRSVRQSLAAIVLGFESVVMFLATLVIFGLKLLPIGIALGGGAALCLLLLVAIGLLRTPVGYPLGWILQVIIFSTALLVPLMIIVGALFGGMWVYCVVRGTKIDRQKAAHG